MIEEEQQPTRYKRQSCFIREEYLRPDDLHDGDLAVAMATLKKLGDLPPDEWIEGNPDDAKGLMMLFRINRIQLGAALRHDGRIVPIIKDISRGNIHNDD